jgi:hypothetical protein
MNLPNADRAIVDPAKVRDYLLSAIHPVGRFKAAFFVSLGYAAEQWELLRDEILALARTETAATGELTAFGQKFELDGILNGPSGRSAQVRFVWMLRTGEQLPRFVTAFPR